MENDIFEIKNNSHIKYLPNYLILEITFMRKMKDYTINISFGKITGLAFLCYKITPDKPIKFISTSDEIFFKSNVDYENAKNHMKKLFEWNETENNYDDIRYSFTYDKFDLRYNEWYNCNKYKEYEKLGMASDYSTIVKSGWVINKEDENINKFNPDELISFNDFLVKLENNFF